MSNYSPFYIHLVKYILDTIDTKKYFFIILLLGYLLYGQTTKYGFTDLDDTILIKEDSLFIRNISNTGQAFTQTVFYMRPQERDIYYRPLLVLSFILDAQFKGSSPHVFHITNILFHCIAVFLLFLLLIRLEYKKSTSFIISLFFLSHPAFTAAVAWLPGRNDTILAVFMLGAFITLINYLKKPTTKRLIINIFFFLLCLFTKENAIILPILFVLFLLKDKSTEITPSLKHKNTLLFAGWFSCTALYYIARKSVIPDGSATNMHEITRLFKEYSPTLLQYIGKMIFPFNLSTYPKMEDTTLLYGVLALIIIYFSFFRKRAFNPSHFWLGLTWFILFLLPTGIIGENALEHRLYIPGIGFSIMCASNKTINNLSFDKGFPKWIVISTLLLFCILTFLHSKNFKDVDPFWKKARQTSPHSALARLHMGIYYHFNNNIEKAEEEYRMAIQIDPFLKDNHNNLGKIMLDKGLLEEAEMLLKTELEITPDHALAYYNLSSIRQRQGKYTEAKKYLEKAVTINPNYTDALNDLGTLLAMEKKYDEALQLFHKALQIEPTYKLSHKNIALLYLSKKEYAKAKFYYLNSKNLGINIYIPILDSLKIDSLDH